MLRGRPSMDLRNCNKESGYMCRSARGQRKKNQDEIAMSMVLTRSWVMFAVCSPSFPPRDAIQPHHSALARFFLSLSAQLLTLSFSWPCYARCLFGIGLFFFFSPIIRSVVHGLCKMAVVVLALSIFFIRISMQSGIKMVQSSKREKKKGNCLALFCCCYHWKQKQTFVHPKHDSFLLLFLASAATTNSSNRILDRKTEREERATISQSDQSSTFIACLMLQLAKK